MKCGMDKWNVRNNLLFLHFAKIYDLITNQIGI